MNGVKRNIERGAGEIDSAAHRRADAADEVQITIVAGH